MIFEADCIKQKYLKASLIRQNHWRKFRIETIYKDETMVLPREWLDFIKNDIQQVQYLPRIDSLLADRMDSRNGRLFSREFRSRANGFSVFYAG